MGDDIMAIAALDMLAHGTLAEKTLITTVMSTPAWSAILCSGGRSSHGRGRQKCDRRHLRGGFQPRRRAERPHDLPGLLDDGRRAGLCVANLRIMKARGKPLSELASCWTRYPSWSPTSRAREEAFRSDRGRAPLVAQAEAELQSLGGRVLLRYSGTEPKVRLLVEGPDAAVLEKMDAADSGRNQAARWGITRVLCVTEPRFDGPAHTLLRATQFVGRLLRT